MNKLDGAKTLKALKLQVTTSSTFVRASGFEKVAFTVATLSSAWLLAMGSWLLQHI